MHDDYVALCGTQRRFGVDLLAASLPTRVEANTATARISSNGVASHKKIQMTLRARSGDRWRGRLRVFRTDYGLVAIAICYDAEFPELVRRQTDAGATIMPVPSCTDTAHGAARRDRGARASRISVSRVRADLGRRAVVAGARCEYWPCRIYRRSIAVFRPTAFYARRSAGLTFVDLSLSALAEV